MVYKHITFIVQSVTQENDIYNGKNSVKKLLPIFIFPENIPISARSPKDSE